MNLGLNADLTDSLNKAGLKTVESILVLSPLDLQRLTSLTSKEVTHVLNAAAQSVTKQGFVSVLNIVKQRCPEGLTLKTISTGCKYLDAFLRGGIPVLGVTEISGESASGKTQFCLQMSLNVQMDDRFGGLNGGAVYICTEDAFPSNRLNQMVTLYGKTQPHQPIKFMDNILIKHVADLEGLKFTILHQIPALLNQKSLKLIVIDSLTALFRAEFDPGSLMTRASLLQSIGAKLRLIAQQQQIAVICVNQISDVISSTEATSSFGSTQVIPSLGIAWSNMVTTRILLSRTERTVTYGNLPGSQVECRLRKMSVLFAPHLPQEECHFVVDSMGVKGVT